MNYFIYAIIDPRSDDVFYIGETGNYERRCKEHIEGTDQLSGQVIGQIKANGFVPRFCVLERCETEECAMRAEIFWIETLKARGARLTNAQAFSGYTDRRRARGRETSKLQRMKRLRKLANGYPATGLDKRQQKRFQGMVDNGMKPAAISKILGVPVRKVRQMMSEI